MTITSHPVYQAIKDAGYFGERALPSDQELDALNLPDDARRKVAEACRQVAEINATGHHAQAWSAADENARQIIDALPAEQRDPGYLRQPDPLADVTDPLELANAIPRMY